MNLLWVLCRPFGRTRRHPLRSRDSLKTLQKASGRLLGCMTGKRNAKTSSNPHFMIYIREFSFIFFIRLNGCRFAFLKPMTLLSWHRFLETVKTTLLRQANLGAWSRMKNRARISRTISDVKNDMEGTLRRFSVSIQPSCARTSFD